MDLIFGGVNANNYFMIWGFVMLMIPLSLIAKYSFGNELTDSINFTQFQNMIDFSNGLETIIPYFTVIIFAICFSIAIGVGTASSIEYSVQFSVFLTFSLLFFVCTIMSFIYMKDRPKS
jgi:ABC-type spermidine/putrescine transport system permease subunit II